VNWPEMLEVVVEIPKFTHRKRRADGTIDFVSPVPSPFNYGSVLGSLAGDGDPEDVIILGPKLALGTRAQMVVRGRIQFTDAGVTDDKWVVGMWPPSQDTWMSVRAFFTIYARFKRVLYRARRVRGETRFHGVIIR
jgi:inorganic pyrophosphatase